MNREKHFIRNLQSIVANELQVFCVTFGGGIESSFDVITGRLTI